MNSKDFCRSYRQLHLTNFDSWNADKSYRTWNLTIPRGRSHKNKSSNQIKRCKMKCFSLPSISLVYFKIARHFQNTQCAIKEEKWKVNQIGRKTKTFKYRFDAGKIDVFKFNYQEWWDSIMRSETLFISVISI